MIRTVFHLFIFLFKFIIGFVCLFLNESKEIYYYFGYFPMLFTKAYDLSYLYNVLGQVILDFVQILMNS